VDGELAAAILCGGRSRRMGRDKAWVEVGGSSLLERAVARLRTVADPVILAGGDRTLDHPGCLGVLDPVPGSGPLGGLVAALRASPHELCAVVAVDMPDLSPELLRRLAEQWRGEDAVVPLDGDGSQPLHAVYSRRILAAAQAALRAGDLSLRGLLERARVRTVDVAALPGHPFPAGFALNLNTPDELARWAASRAGAGGGERPGRTGAGGVPADSAR